MSIFEKYQNEQMFNFFLGKPAFPCDSGEEHTVAATNARTHHLAQYTPSGADDEAKAHVGRNTHRKRESTRHKPQHKPNQRRSQ
ncbi:hypothetical protein JOD55_000065 [Arcanobacterium pluranimalium]|uniref:hypothetical protein n=1 Tax=Arcanobacterium pluranimalium TaxID=108028 RepID=UPI00195F0570|nr:hypothetical protein [Arcanobacterium pluranimalium]MBM7824238.1 hypothetical protein [Arcanobacterium pluranimalium]